MERYRKYNNKDKIVFIRFAYAENMVLVIYCGGEELLNVD
jgi:hypothetical protein